MKVEAIFYWAGAIWFVAGMAIELDFAGLFIGTGLTLMFFALAAILNKGSHHR